MRNPAAARPREVARQEREWPIDALDRESFTAAVIDVCAMCLCVSRAKGDRLVWICS